MVDKFLYNRRLPRISETTCKTCLEMCEADSRYVAMSPVVTYDFGKGVKISLCLTHYDRMREPYEPFPNELVEGLR